jgi:hypothetical protein
VADWVAISGLATAGGTLALAATTYASVRSANRAARVAELSLMAGLRPLLVESAETDPTLRVNFRDVHGVAVPGGRAAVEIVDGNVFIVISLRNVGSGIAVLHGGRIETSVEPSIRRALPSVDDFSLLGRDIYVPPGTVGFWQIGFRDDTGEKRDVIAGIENGYLIADVLYGDFEGGQRVITRYGLPREDDGWHVTTVRHWQLDRPEPRQRD